jgi:WD40 repeat protein
MFGVWHSGSVRYRIQMILQEIPCLPMQIFEIKTMSILRFFLCSAIVIVLSSCGGVSPIPSKTLPVPTAQATHTFTVQPTATEDTPENKELVYDIAVSRDNQNLAVLTTKGIYLFDGPTLTQNRFIDFESNAPREDHSIFSPAITFTPDGSKLVFSNENRFVTWNLINQDFDPSNSSFSAIRKWDISNIEYSPKGDRIMVTTHGDDHICDATGVDLALYDLEFTLLFDKSFCIANAESYYRFVSDNRVYIFLNARSMFFPLEFYDVELSTGNVMKKAEYDPYSGNAENFIYDVSLDGRFLAIGNYSNYKFKTKIIEANSGNTLKEVDGGVDFSLEGFGKQRKSNSNEIVNEKCGLINKPDEGEQYTILASNQSTLVLTISDWDSFADWKDVKSLELWDLSSCEIKKTITFSQVQ